MYIFYNFSLLNSLDGSSKFFASHPLKFTKRLRHNETGALEFTFFLRSPLPSTTSTIEGGRIVLYITPKIPNPPVGTIACFFYNTIPASSCTWDDSDPLDTEVVIGTPTTMPYFRSEIPITITTQTDVGYVGIKLPELIQRYRFYFQFYENDSEVPFEYSYDDYVPEPIILESQDYNALITPIQYEKEAYLRITWTNNYLSLGQNYFFEVAFDHRNQAWDYNLG